MGAPSSLLLVDDDLRFRERMGAALRERGVDVHLAADGASASRLLRGQQVDAVVTDLKMPGGSGLDLVREVNSNYPAVRVVVLTGYGTIATAVEAMRLGAVDYLVKPCNADQLLAVFDDAQRERHAAGKEVSEDDAAVPSLARLEREHIERVLVECGGNISKTAKLLGIHRRTLQYKLAKFPLLR
jgi:two-component system, response regulator RegA